MAHPDSTAQSTPMPVRSWQQFDALMRCLHFGRAATQLHMSQPALTQAIARLEHELGVLLFDRTQRRVLPTPAAEALWTQVQDWLAQGAVLTHLARRVAEGSVGRLKLAFVSTIGFEALPAWIRAFRQLHPGVVLDLVEATWDVQLPQIEGRQLDAGLLLHAPGAAPAGCQALRVAREPWCLAIPASHRLAAQAQVTLDDLGEEQVLMVPRRILPSLHDQLHALYQASELRLQVVQEAIQMQTIVNLVSADLGLAWVPGSVQHFQRSGVVYRPFQPTGRQQTPWCDTSLVWHPDNPNPALARWVDLTHRHLDPMDAPDQVPS